MSQAKEDSKVSDLVKSLSDFVREVCEGRDESHGHAHMQQVYQTSLEIFREIDINEFGLIPQYLLTPMSFVLGSRDKLAKIERLIIIVSWLHDVNDHKYDTDGKLGQKITKYLSDDLKLPDSEIKLILDIIDRISYSKENKLIQNGIKRDWDHVLGVEGTLVRDVVSDADKLDALGKVGFERCREYTIHSLTKKYGKADPEQVKTQIKEHAKEKLLRLKDEFIRTGPGKRRAVKLHQELLECLSQI